MYQIYYWTESPRILNLAEPSTYYKQREDAEAAAKRLAAQHPALTKNGPLEVK